VPDYIDAKDVVELPETIDITVAGGDDSGKVSRKLYNAGIIDNASEFDAFLMQHGYDKKITVGTKTINITDTWQEIAEKLTHK
jgi:cell division protein YceG involved in septum cleavage